MVAGPKTDRGLLARDSPAEEMCEDAQGLAVGSGEDRSASRVPILEPCGTRRLRWGWKGSQTLAHGEQLFFVGSTAEQYLPKGVGTDLRAAFRPGNCA